MRIGIALFLLFTVGPILETWLIIQVGSRIGATETTLSLVLAGLVGAWLGKRAGSTVIRELFDGLKRGEPPADKIVEGVLALIGAVLLVTPGYLSDVAGLVCLWQPTRRWLAPRVKTALWEGLKARGFTFVGNGGPGPGFQGTRPSAHAGSKGQPAEKPHPQFDHPIAE